MAGTALFKFISNHGTRTAEVTDPTGHTEVWAVADSGAPELRPALRVLYTSGYTENAIVHHGRLDADAQLLSKPYRRSDLERAVRAALTVQKA